DVVAVQVVEQPRALQHVLAAHAPRRRARQDGGSRLLVQRQRLPRRDALLAGHLHVARQRRPLLADRDGHRRGRRGQRRLTIYLGLTRQRDGPVHHAYVLVPVEEEPGAEDRRPPLNERDGGILDRRGFLDATGAVEDHLDVRELEGVLPFFRLGVDWRTDDGEGGRDDGVLHACLDVTRIRPIDDREALPFDAVRVVADAPRAVRRLSEVADDQLRVVPRHGEAADRLRGRQSNESNAYDRHQAQPSPARPRVHSWFSSLRANAAGSNSLATEASMASKKSNSMSCLMRSVTRLAPLSESTASAG